MTTKILNQAQAEAVYSAMCALNNVGGRVDANLPIGGRLMLRVRESEGGEVFVFMVEDGRQRQEMNEIYAGQSTFATAYGLSETCPECGGRGEIETGIGMMACTSCPN